MEWIDDKGQNHENCYDKKIEEHRLGRVDEERTFIHRFESFLDSGRSGEDAERRGRRGGRSSQPNLHASGYNFCVGELPNLVWVGLVVFCPPAGEGRLLVLI